MEKPSFGYARYLPFGDSALLVEFGETISLELNRKVTALSESILKAEIPDVEELVPTYRSLLVRYDPTKMTYEKLVFRIKEIEQNLLEPSTIAEGKKVSVPVVYGGEFGPDLNYVARYHGLTEEQVVQLHSEVDYRVYMIGFVAGFPYLGQVSEQIATPRLSTPRIKVPAGSVGIAEKQTGIYPREAPGGWQIIGRTALTLFNPLSQRPSLLEPGDTVKFRPVSEKEFEKIQQSPKNSSETVFRK